jgi:hypothetical protein
LKKKKKKKMKLLLFIAVALLAASSSHAQNVAKPSWPGELSATIAPFIQFEYSASQQRALFTYSFFEYYLDCANKVGYTVANYPGTVSPYCVHSNPLYTLALCPLNSDPIEFYNKFLRLAGVDLLGNLTLEASYQANKNHPALFQWSWPFSGDGRIAGAFYESEQASPLDRTPYAYRNLACSGDDDDDDDDTGEVMMHFTSFVRGTPSFQNAPKASQCFARNELPATYPSWMPCSSNSTGTQTVADQVASLFASALRFIQDWQHGIR